MNKKQFILLNVLAVLFFLLTGVRYLLIKDLESSRNRVVQMQAMVSQGQQSEQILRKIILRVAQGSEREPDLRDLLKQFNVTVTNNPTAAAPLPASPAPAGVTPTPAKPRP